MNTAREIAEQISNGILKPTHLGEKSFEVLKQELFSLKNQWNPNTWTESEKTGHNQNLTNLISQIEHLDDSKKQTLYSEVDRMLNP